MLSCCVSWIVSWIVSFTMSVISIFVSGFHCVSWCTASMVLISWGLMLYVCSKLCSSVGYHFTSCAVAFATGLCNGWVGGSIAKHCAAWWQCLSTSRWNGRRFAMMSRTGMDVNWASLQAVHTASHSGWEDIGESQSATDSVIYTILDTNFQVWMIAKKAPKE